LLVIKGANFSRRPYASPKDPPNNKYGVFFDKEKINRKMNRNFKVSSTVGAKNLS
jgi:hypothetical protein